MNREPEKQAADPASLSDDERGFIDRLVETQRRARREDRAELAELLAQTQAIFKALPGRTDTPLRKTLLSAEEVCSIINICKGAGVSVLKFRGLYVRFGHADRGNADHPPAAPKTETAVSDLPGTEAEISAQATEAEERTLLRDELAVRKQQIEELPITNPLEFERRLASGELEDDDDGADEEA